MIRAVLSRRFLIVLFLVAVLSAPGCRSVLQYTPIGLQADGTVVEKVTGFPKPDAEPVGGPLSETDLKISLQRIIVRYHAHVSFAKLEPEPLLTKEQMRTYAEVLAKEFPGLQPNQRIRFSFKDARKRNLNQIDVYRDGPYIVFYFNVFVGNPKLAMNAGDPPFSEADLQELPGQKISYERPAAIILRDPAQGSKEAAMADVAGAKAMIEKYRVDDMISGAEAARLMSVVDANPTVRSETWRVYWEKRLTLKKAREQNLVDDTAYQAQLAKIEQETIGK